MRQEKKAILKFIIFLLFHHTITTFTVYIVDVRQKTKVLTQIIKRFKMNKKKFLMVLMVVAVSTIAIFANGRMDRNNAQYNSDGTVTCAVTGETYSAEEFSVYQAENAQLNGFTKNDDGTYTHVVTGTVVAENELESYVSSMERQAFAVKDGTGKQFGNKNTSKQQNQAANHTSRNSNFSNRNGNSSNRKGNR